MQVLAAIILMRISIVCECFLPWQESRPHFDIQAFQQTNSTVGRFFSSNILKRPSPSDQKKYSSTPFSSQDFWSFLNETFQVAVMLCSLHYLVTWFKSVFILNNKKSSLNSQSSSFKLMLCCLPWMFLKLRTGRWHNDTFHVRKGPIGFLKILTRYQQPSEHKASQFW